MTQAVFAIPGDKDQSTGGYIYDATVLRCLNELGVKTAHLQLPDSFPNPSNSDRQAAHAALCKVPQDQPVIIDGLALGAMDADGLDDVSAPIIAMVHHPLGLETGLLPDRAQALIANETAVLKRAAHVIVPSDHIADTLVADLGVNRCKITTAPPGFTRPDVAQDRATPPLILSVGLLARRKGHDVLLAALGRLTALDWQAEIVGRPQDQEVAQDLYATVGARGLTERVRFAGEVDAQDLHDSYRRASIFALATRYEGYGMVLSEAMLHGLPVVSTRVGAVPQTVGDAGLLVDPDDPVALADALQSLLSDPALADHYADKSREQAAKLPRWQDTAQYFVHVIEKLRA